MFKTLKSRLFAAIADRLIRRAQRTPYFHLYHDDGRLYMERFWLIRFGLPRDWRVLEHQLANWQIRANSAGTSSEYRAYARQRIAELQAKLYPRFGIRIHHIVSSDESVFHDHPWDFTTLILRGGYLEVTPDWTQGATPAHVTVSDDYDGHEPMTYGMPCYARHTAGALIRRKAGEWHYLTIAPGQDAWTLFCTGRKRQRWGFLVDGLVKVPYNIYLPRRAERAARDANA